jgi:hypothetical protein
MATLRLGQRGRVNRRVLLGREPLPLGLFGFRPPMERAATDDTQVA